jgi:Sulfotransferase family
VRSPEESRVRSGAAAVYREATNVVRAVERSVRLPVDRRAVHAASFRGGFRRAYHFHVRKTGGTSLNRAFLGLGGEDPASVHWRMRGALHATRSNGRVYVAHDAPLLERGYYTYGWHHAPAWTLTLPPETFTITVLRDPISRVLSLYRYLLDPDADADQPFRAGREERARAAGGFESFVRSTPTVDLLNQVHMFSPRLDPAEAAEAVRHCSAWFMTEDLGQGVDRLNQSLGLDLKHRWDRRSRTDDGLRVQHGDLLRTVLAPEYELLQLLGAENDGPAGQPSSQSPDGIQLPRRS